MSTSHRLAPARRPLIGLGLIGTALLVIGRPAGAVVAWASAPLLAQAAVLSPAFTRLVDERLAPGIGRLVTLLLLLPIQLLIVLPVWLVSRLLGLDPVEAVAGHGQWRKGPSVAPQKTRRSFASERHMRARGQGWGWRAGVALLTIGVLIGVVAPRVFERDDGDVPTALQTDDGFNAMQSPAIVDEPWADRAATEFFEAVAQGQTYTPYIGYSVRDFTGQHVNVAGRQRASYQPAGVVAEASPPEVWFFGGSTMFGFSGQRDDHTIPSEIARLAEADGLAVRVRNFGAPGYVNFQETVLLAQLLLAGGRPDAVVFYDGINDLALQLQRSFAFGEAGELGDLLTEATRQQLAGTLTGTDAPPAPLNPELPFADPGTALVGLTRTIGQGVELNRTLADRYGFEVVHAWQPDLFSKARLDPGEASLIGPLGYDDFRFDALDGLSDQARGQLPDGILDLGDAYDDLDGPVLTDVVHTNEAGARAVAEALYPALRPVLTTASGEG